MKRQFLNSLIELISLTDRNELVLKQKELMEQLGKLRFVIPDAKFSSMTKGLLKTNIDDYVNNPNATYKRQIEIQISMIGEVILD